MARQPIPRSEPQRREHVSTDANTYRACRNWQILGDPRKAVEVAYAAGLRLDLADLILPFTTTLARLTDPDERREFAKRWREELDGESRAVARLEAIERTGHNDHTRAGELAAARAKREQAERDHAAAVEATTQALIAQQDADRIAAARRTAAAICTHRRPVA